MRYIWRTPVVPQPINVSDMSISTRDPRLFQFRLVTWFYVIGHVWFRVAGVSTFGGDGTAAVSWTERDVVHLRIRRNTSELKSYLKFLRF